MQTGFESFASDSIPSFKEPSEAVTNLLESDPSLQYSIDSPAEELPLLSMIKAYFAKWFSEMWKGVFGTSLIYYLLFAIGFSAILYFLIRILGPDRIGLRKNVMPEQSAPLELESIGEQDLKALLLVAEKAKDWRSHIGIQFHMILKQMEQKGHINISGNKTNRDYCFEISDKTLSSRFENLGRTFEYIWYGGFEANEERAQNYSHLRKTLFGQ
jgi:hypothetical protein